MIADVEALRAALRRGEHVEYLFFWGHRARQDGKIGPSCLSQWWPCDMTIDGVHYPTCEHYMMAQKARLFGDDAAHEAILAARDPGKAKALGRRVQRFDEARWHEARYDIVVRANQAKFSQHDPLRYFLLGTRDKVLVEASPSDRIWGIGLAKDDPRATDPHQWQGTNLLGFALMQVREGLRQKTR